MIFPTIRINIERWKWNKTFEVYVSTMGRVKNRSKMLIPPKTTCHDYLCFYIPHIRKFISAHRLVMLTWQPRSDAEFLTVDHINHNKRDNSLYNLEWVTTEENLRRAVNDHAADACPEEPKLKKKKKKKKKNYSGNVVIYQDEKIVYKLNYSKIESEAFKAFCKKRNIAPSVAIETVRNLFTGVNTMGAKKKFGLFFELEKGE